MLNITRLREMIDLANCLKFESFKIIALKQFSKLANSTIVKENERLAFVTNNLEKTKKDKCEMLYVQNYEENRKFLFITYLHNDKNKQFEKITFYFKLKFTYLEFYNMSNNFNSQQHLITMTKKLLSSTISLT